MDVLGSCLKAFVDLKTLSSRGKAFNRLGMTREKEESLILLPFPGGSSLGGPVEEHTYGTTRILDLHQDAHIARGSVANCLEGIYHISAP